MSKDVSGGLRPPDSVGNKFQIESDGYVRAYNRLLDYAWSNDVSDEDEEIKIGKMIIEREFEGYITIYEERGNNWFKNLIPYTRYERISYTIWYDDLYPPEWIMRRHVCEYDNSWFGEDDLIRCTLPMGDGKNAVISDSLKPLLTQLINDGEFEDGHSKQAAQWALSVLATIEL